MTDLTTLSDRALKVLVILLLAAQPVGKDFIRARYARPMGVNGLKDALFELTEARLIARTGFRGACWIATPTARQLILGETSPREV